MSDICPDCGIDADICHCDGRVSHSTFDPFFDGKTTSNDIYPEEPSPYCESCGFMECQCIDFDPNIPMTIAIPKDVYDAILRVSGDNGQTPEVTVLATLDRWFTNIPVVIPLDPRSLKHIYMPTGLSVADTLKNKAKSARIEVLL